MGKRKRCEGVSDEDRGLQRTTDTHKADRHHVDSPYRNRKPDYAVLAQRFPDLAEHVSWNVDGTVHVDLRTVDAQVALTTAMLKEVGVHVKKTHRHREQK